MTIQKKVAGICLIIIWLLLLFSSAAYAQVTVPSPSLAHGEVQLTNGVVLSGEIVELNILDLDLTVQMTQHLQGVISCIDTALSQTTTWTPQDCLSRGFPRFKLLAEQHNALQARIDSLLPARSRRRP